MIYQAIPQQPNMIPQELPMYQSPPTPQLQMIKAPLSQDDQYKRPVMGSIVMMCTLMLLAMDCMGLFEEVWTLINNPTQVNYWIYIGMGYFIWSVPNNVMALICAIGQYMTFWSNLIIYTWICFAIFFGFQVYTSILLIRAIIATTDSGIREEYTFSLIFDFAMYTIYAVRQICFFRLYNKPASTIYYVLPYYNPQTQKP